jgi:diguanylate cyclase (GGDEF)-like protein/PAS domain S-box-containing protein
VSAKLLLPLAGNAKLDNLFSALDTVAPGLRRLVEDFDAVHGPICDGLRIECKPEPPLRPDRQILALTLHKTGPDQLVAVLSDITLQVWREQELLQYQAWSNAALTGAGAHAVASLDASGHIVDWQSNAATGFGFQREQVMGRPYAVFYPDGAITADRLADRLHEADENGWSLDEGWRVRGDGGRYWGSTMIVPLRGRGAAAAPAYSLLMRDTTDQRESFERQRRASARDELTGLCNRRSFLDAAELELARWRRSPRPLSVVMFDADHFKAINDTRGHAAGDAVLRRLAELFARTFRQIDVAARIGGEEFAVLLPSTDIHAAELVANRLRLAVMESPIRVDGIAVTCTVSGGVATIDSQVTSVADLLERADRALYAAKAAGRNCIVCDQTG